jgi:uncharacterized RDD family membrane protein YckC
MYNDDDRYDDYDDDDRDDDRDDDGEDRGYDRYENRRYDDDYPLDDDQYDPLDPIHRFPLAPLWRRASALAIDGIIAGVPSSIGSPGLQLIGFALLWFVLRVVVVSKNRGQSLGRWAFDLRIIDAEFGRLPGLLPLCKREAILGFAVLLCLEAIVHLNPQSAWVILGLVPLGVDFTLAYSDRAGKQTYHDRVADTYVVKSRRGYSLDLRLKRLFGATRPVVQQEPPDY